MKLTYTVRTQALLVVIVASLVMIGWYMNIPLLKSIHPQWVTMKFSTALCFVLSGVLLYTLTFVSPRESVSGYAQIAIVASTLGLFHLMGLLFFSILFDIKIGVEELFVSESNSPVMSSNSGTPSIGTMINFMLIASSGIVLLLRERLKRLALIVAGVVTTATASIAILGYVLNIPMLYFYIDPWSTAMAMHTALLFLIMGLGFVLESFKPMGTSG